MSKKKGSDCINLPLQKSTLSKNYSMGTREIMKDSKLRIKDKSD